MSIQEAKLTTSRYELAGLQNSDSDGDLAQPLTLAIHGWLDNAASFLPLLEVLDGQYHLMALDMVGHGHSAHRSTDANYHLLDYVQDLHEMVIALRSQGHCGPLRLIGHSLGGIIASIYSAAFNEQVDKLVLLESVGPMVESETTTAEQIRSAIESRIDVQQKMFEQRIRQPGSMNSLLAARRKATPVSDDLLLPIMQRNTFERDGQLRWQSDIRLRTRSSMRFTEGQAKAVLSSIRCPLMIVLAQDGFEKLKQAYQYRQDSLPEHRFLQLPGPHHFHLPEAEALAGVFLNFVS